MKRPSPVLICLALVGLTLAAPLAAGDTARSWLDRMSAAMNQMTYQGTFVYIQGDEMETMRITHVSGADGVRERLVSLSGDTREVFRDGEGVRWSLGKEGAVLADSGFTRSFFPALPPDFAGTAGKSYDFKMGEETLRYLMKEGARRITVVNRGQQRAEAGAERGAGKAAPCKESQDSTAALDSTGI